MKNGLLCSPLTALTLFFLNIPTSFAVIESPQVKASELAIQVLAKHNDVPLDKLQVDSVKAIQWPDSSLGCPQPGMMYTQMVTPGFQITLLDLSKSTTHYVHVGAGRAIVCDKTASTRSQTEKNLHFGQRWQQSQKAQKLLADRLSVAHNEIRIVGTRNIPTDKLSPSCRGKGKNTQSQIIELSYKNKVYRYGIIGDHLVYCD